MTPREAVLAVLAEASEPLHWTVVQDRALRAGMIDPFTVRDVRRAVLGALRELVARGAVVRRGTGVYEIAGPTDGGAVGDVGPAGGGSVGGADRR